jgi:hypothetical protein
MRYNCTQKIGVVKARILDDLVNGRYASSGNFLVAPDNQQTFEVATNPAVTEGPDGKYYMMYKSRTPSPGHMTFWMATGDKPDGPFTTISAVLNTADMACEDPSLWYDKKRKRFYAAAKYFSNAKILAPESGALVLITSADGLHWTSARQSLISLKQLKFSDGHTEKLARLERPFVVVDAEGQPVALFSAASVQSPAGGDPEHVIPANNSFNVQIPLLKQK